MKRVVIGGALVVAALLFAQPTFAQCNQDTLRAWIENAITNSQTTLRAQIEDAITNSRTTLRAQLEDAITNSRTTLRAQLEARIDDSTLTILDALGATGVDGLKDEIEEALRINRRIASYYLPEPEGNLSLARQIVADTIANVAASGESTNQAASKLASADFDIAGGRYKRAWGFLSAAYFEAIKILGETQ